MINTKEVIRTVNTVLKRNSDKYLNSIALQNQDKSCFLEPAKPIICSFKLSICEDFYKSISNKNYVKKVCPFGFTICKRKFVTATNYKTISVFSIIDFSYNPKTEVYLNNLPKKLKPKREETKKQLQSIQINKEEHIKNKDYIEGLVETLLIGRIGLAIQSISHQFFTPLQGAMSDVKNLEIGRDQKESLSRLVKNFSALNRLATEVQLLLSTSKEFNTNMLRRVTVHVMVNEIFSSLIASANEKNLGLTQSRNNISRTVQAIPGQLNIVLMNIIQNAIKYSYNGIPENPLEINISYDESENNELIIAVKNQGCKITKEEIEQRLIFNLGYRGDYSGDRQRHGSGSGLYISNEIVVMHGGKIEVSSKFCGGSQEQQTDRYENIFFIYWPILVEQ